MISEGVRWYGSGLEVMSRENSGNRRPYIDVSFQSHRPVQISLGRGQTKSDCLINFAINPALFNAYPC